MDEVLHDRPARSKRSGLFQRRRIAHKFVPVLVSVLSLVGLVAVNSSSASESPNVPPTSTAPVPALQRVLAPAAAATLAEKVLILNSTVVGGVLSIEATEAVAKGFTVDLVDAATWGAMTLADFKSYRAIILGDPNNSVIPAAGLSSCAG